MCLAETRSCLGIHQDLGLVSLQGLQSALKYSLMLLENCLQRTQLHLINLSPIQLDMIQPIPSQKAGTSPFHNQEGLLRFLGFVVD